MRTIQDIQYIPTSGSSVERTAYKNRPADIVAEYASYMEEMSKRRQPLEQLPMHFDPKYNKLAPKLRYGFLVQTDRLLEYALAEDLVPEDFVPTSKHSALIYPLNHLRDLTGTRLQLCKPWSGGGGQFIISLYSNHTMRRKHYTEEYEKIIVEVLQEELGIEDEARWHWDASCQ
ncbi:hypothetical protein FA95DRAFT_1596367 [Auriscalpium vulgare]|uniref:Uncharacterized protein n=1 Tax=Auriscalpium vulgare TaxID=40419 RepID=A0ACB8RQ26_9AGAM|nr:hypothetical protein FA95DRAFT_1596367 [Auriscalpium vulgare]